MKELPQPGEQLSPDNRKPGIMQRSRGFLQDAVGSITGKELPQLVDAFTREMVIVAEGLSEDQAKLRDALTLQGEEQDREARKLREIEKQLSDTVKRVEELHRAISQKKKAEAGLSRILRQATWLAAIIGGAWIISSLINLIGR